MALTNPFGTYPITNPFGAPGSAYVSGYHTGIDFGMPEGTPVQPIDDGTVTFADYDGAFGNVVRVAHAWGESWYAHLSRIEVGVGQAVSAGDELGLSGTTGLSTGPHLHLQVMVDGVPVDPTPYLAGTPGTPAPGGNDGVPGTPGRTDFLTNPWALVGLAAALGLGLAATLRR